MSIAYQSILPTPIFNTHLIPFIPNELNNYYDKCNLLRQIETIAFPGTVFEKVKDFSSHLMEVTTTSYLSHAPLYIDKRFVREVRAPYVISSPQLPSSQELLTQVLKRQGTRYFWGGNVSQGIPEMIALYPESPVHEHDLLCKGVDCSGLLYEATQGLTPRNTRDLIHYGAQVLQDPSSLLEVQRALKPLDLIVWNGHVLIALNPYELIESREGRGVVISPLEERLFEIRTHLQQKKIPFFIRRWHPDFLS
ncbi:MAG: hypothetical protein QRY71_04755 [Candidatus Rhabdochlamydia sp.]